MPTHKSVKSTAAQTPKTLMYAGPPTKHSPISILGVFLAGATLGVTMNNLLKGFMISMPINQILTNLALGHLQGPEPCDQAIVKMLGPKQIREYRDPWHGALKHRPVHPVVDEEKS